MTQFVFAFVGISGCGKTTSIKKLNNIMQFQYLSAGSIIAEQRNLDDENRDTLRLKPVAENQTHLLRGFQNHRSKAAKIIVLDGHVAIRTADAYAFVDAKVFSDLGVSAFVHLTASPELISQNRINDPFRKRPIIGLEQAQEDQEVSIAAAKDVASVLGTPIVVADVSEIEAIAKFMSKVVQSKVPCPPKTSQTNN